MSGWQEVRHAEPGLGAWYSSGEDWLVHVQAQKVVESAMLAGRTVPTVGSGVEVASEVGEQKGSLYTQESPGTACWRSIILGTSTTKLLVSSVLSSQ